jgi:uncharacterized protein YbjQ (UPF0145 family)
MTKKDQRIRRNLEMMRGSYTSDSRVYQSVFNSMRKLSQESLDNMYVMLLTSAQNEAIIKAIEEDNKLSEMK